ncbi:MAG TPA: hypothetical protein PL041_02475 [Melioribacteraceae bacterium]|nr:hypothetical protein [Melioribacteraceae bacterium]
MINDIKSKFTNINVANIYSSTKINNYLKNQEEKAGDRLELSEIAKEMASYPFAIDAERISNTDNYKFSFSYNDDTIFNLTADGVYYSKKKQIKTMFNFTYQKEVFENGVKTNKTYEVNMEMGYTIKDEKSAETKKNKESIVDFIKRVVDRVIEINKEDKSLIAGIVFEKEDLDELMSLDGESKQGKSLRDVIYMLVSFLQLKQLLEKDKDKEQVLYAPKRKEENILEINKTKEEDLDINLTIKELVAKNIEEAKDNKDVNSPPPQVQNKQEE